MLRSMFSGVSGLRSHQLKMDVLGNNIANVNTIGFKSGRINFTATLNQSLSGSSRIAGGGNLNPMQVGLGMKVSSINALFNQGSLEQTNNITDMAIDGDGFFILGSNDTKGGNLYTRAGSFSFNADGVLVNNNDLAVRGWMLQENEDGVVEPASTQLGDITLNSNLISKAVATENVYLTGNLNAGLRPVTEVWTMSSELSTKRAELSGTGLTFPVDVTAANNNFDITLVRDGGAPVTGNIVLTENSYANISSLISEINLQIANDSDLSGRVQAIADGTSITFRVLDEDSNLGSTLTLNDGAANSVLGDLGFADGAADTGNSVLTAATDLNQMQQANTDLVADDTIQISGTNPDGSVVNATYTYAPGDTVQDLIDAINTAYTGATATLEDSKIIITDSVGGESETRINLTNGAGNTGEISMPGFLNTEKGFTGKVSTSVVVYDSLGASHNLVFEFTNTENPGEWSWEVIPSGDEQILNGGSGTVRFTESGDLSSFTYDGGVSSLRFDPGQDASIMEVALHADGDEQFSGLSQYDYVTTLNTREQDGRATGEILGITISREGIVRATFSNDDSMVIAKLAMAQFANNEGLVDIGEGLYQSNFSSGEAVTYGLNDNLPSSIISGALEMSNVDLAREFTDMITAQRGYQANARVITTSDQLLNELMNLKR